MYPMSSAIVDKDHLGNLEIYKDVLTQAWEDGIVTKDEFAIMEKVRQGLGISFEEHLANVEECR